MKVNRSQVDIFTDGVTVNAAKIQQPLDVLADALTNTDTRVDNLYSNDQIDSKIASIVAGSPLAVSGSATPDTLIMRDSGGRAKAAAPVASDDIARKTETDAALTVAKNLEILFWMGAI